MTASVPTCSGQRADRYDEGHGSAGRAICIGSLRRPASFARVFGMDRPGVLETLGTRMTFSAPTGALTLTVIE